jgi:hypothetical protein
MSSKQWDKAEEVLGEALKAAEAAAGPDSSSSSSSSGVLVPVLLLLASGYCRSARVMLAEGLLREAAKLLGGSEPHRCVWGGGVFVGGDCCLFPLIMVMCGEVSVEGGCYTAGGQ